MRRSRHYRKIYERKPWKDRGGGFLRLATLSFLFLLVVGVSLFLFFAKDLPRPERFTEVSFARPTQIYDRTGTVLLYELYGEERRDPVSLSQIPVHLQKAVIAIEDANFYRHFGVDPKGIARALLVNLRLRKPVQGGSTIGQQLIRSSLLTTKRTLERKVREIVLTLELERRYSKDQILEFYLNQIPWGSNAYGIGAASRIYFQKKPADLTLGESALLAAMIRAPSYYSPYGARLPELQARKNHVLERMVQLGFIGEQEMSSAQQEGLTFAEPLHNLKAPHFVLEVTDELLKEYGEQFLQEHGLRVQTSLDWQLQQAAEEAVSRFAKTNEAFRAYNTALVALDPWSGEVLAMVGSKDWFGQPYPAGCTPGLDCLFDPKVNVATRIPGRQPGSAFKPFAYVTAFAKGHTDQELVIDQETNFGVWGEKEYIPKNYDGKFRGPVTLRQALAQSLNIPSVKVLLEFAGIAESIQTAREFGLQTIKEDPSFYGPALVLGGGEVRLLDMVSAYGVFATEGSRVPPLSILRISDQEGTLLKERRFELVRVFDPGPTQTVSSILADNEARAPIFGLSSPLFFPDRQVSVKTGTTQDFRDGWIIGYTKNFVAGVWVGNNDNSSMSKEPGIVVAGPLWRSFMDKALQRYP